MSRTTSQHRPSNNTKTTRKPAAAGRARSSSSRSSATAGKTAAARKAPSTRAAATRTSAPARSASPKRSTRASGAKRTPAVRSAPKRPAQKRRGAAMPKWVVPAAVGVALFLGAWQLYPVMRLQYQEQREIAQLERQLKTMKDRNKRLRADVERLKTPEGVEAAARETLGYVRPGENAYVVTGVGMSKEPTIPDVAEDDGLAPGGDPWWVRAADIVFGVRKP